MAIASTMMRIMSADSRRVTNSAVLGLAIPSTEETIGVMKNTAPMPVETAEMRNKMGSSGLFQNGRLTTMPIRMPV